MAIRNVVLYSQTLPPVHVGGIETNAFYLVQYLSGKTSLNLSIVTATKRKFLLRSTLPLQYGNVRCKAHLVRKKVTKDPARITAYLDALGFKPQETVVYHNSLDLYKSYAALKARGYHQVARSGGNDLSFLQKNAGDTRSFCTALAQLDRLFVNSDYSRLRAESIGLSTATLHVVKGGCEVVGRQPMQREQLGLPADRPLIVSCGRLVDFKGLDDALSAIAILKKRGKRPLFVMVGEGALEADLKRYAAELGIDSCCHFVGKLGPARVFDYYHSADIYLSSSKEVVRNIDGFRYTHTETMGRSICEAQGCGLPVVTTDAGGAPEMVLDGKTGLVVPQGNADAMAVALASLIDDARARRAMGEAALQYARQQLGWDAVLGQYVKVMTSLA